MNENIWKLDKSSTRVINSFKVYLGYITYAKADILNYYPHFSHMMVLNIVCVFHMMVLKVELKVLTNLLHKLVFFII